MSLPFSIQAQQNRYFAKNMIIGSSLTWIYEKSFDYPIQKGFNEYTWNVNISVSMNKRLYLGLQLLNIYTSGTDIPSENFSIYGLFAQYNLLSRTDHRFFLESSINRGDYCTCGKYEPYRMNDLHYFGIGIGYDLPIKKLLPGLYVDFSFLNYFLLNRINSKYNYTQYVIGLNYRLG